MAMTTPNRSPTRVLFFSAGYAMAGEEPSGMLGLSLSLLFHHPSQLPRELRAGNPEEKSYKVL